MKGMATCKVCERDFALMAEDHYVSRETFRSATVGEISLSGEGKLYDAFDCPYCGSQYLAQIREPFWNPCDECEESFELYSEEEEGEE